MKYLFTFLLLIGGMIHATERNVPSHYLTIQLALDACQDNDTVSVAPGTYVENIVWPFAKHIKLIGSGSAITTIDANNGGRAISKTSLILDDDILISGFTITNGYYEVANGVGEASGLLMRNAQGELNDLQIDSNIVKAEYIRGAGLCLINCSFLMKNVVSKNNISISWRYVYGVGMYFESSVIQLRNSKSEGNISFSSWANMGCGIYCVGSTVDAMYVDVRNNYQLVDSITISNGAGIYSFSTDLILESCSISMNHLNSMPQATGGGIHHSGKRLTMIETTVNNNYIDSSTESDGVGLYLENDSAYITQCEISYNEGKAVNVQNGVALAAKNSLLEIESSKFQYSIMHPGSQNYFGSIALVDCHTTMLNSLITSNTIDSLPYISYPPTQAGIFAFRSQGSSNLTVNHCTVADHNSYVAYGNSIFSNDVLNISNSIICSKTGYPEILTVSSVARVEYSNISNMSGGIGNISVDPIFAGPNDYHLNPSSPCAGTGNGNMVYDLDLIMRPQPAATNPDIGAYEVNQGTLNISNDNSLDKFIISPNPASDKFNLILHSGNSKTISIFISDIYGRKLLEQNEYVTEGINIIPLVLPVKISGIVILTVEYGLTIKKFEVVILK